MKTAPFFVSLVPAIIILASVTSSRAVILSVTGNDTLVGNRPSNLITNGSFEADGGVATNYSYWATGTALTPTMSLTGWAGFGQSGSYAVWGNDGLGGTRLSAPLPHGTNGVYFGAGIMSLVIPFPVEATNGIVSFTNTPVILPKPTDGPVTLQQSVTGLNPSTTYLLDFWTSGENVSTTGFPVDGFFGLDITGEQTLYFAAPGGFGPTGNSQRYQVYFTPTSSTVTFEWINWGHYLDPNGMSDELVLDDVILNAVSNAPVTIDCNCLTNLTLTCPAVVPDLCALAVNCFGTNMIPGSCIQNFPPGFPLTAGTYVLNVVVTDWQSNNVSCGVTINVLPQVPTPPLTVVCPTNKTVECGSGWSFDSPVIVSSCCGVTITSSDNVLSQTLCSEVIERVFTITDGCGNITTCTQKVTTVDTTPPGRQCGQNLVPNPSFERYTNCPNTISQFDFAAPWFTPTDGTSDLFSSCGGPWSFMSTPTNMAGVQAPVTGQAYAGAVVWSVYGLNTNNTYRDYREYLEVPLLSPLFGGQRYQVSFYVSCAESRPYAIAELGACLTPGPLVTNGFYRNFNVVPQVENPSTNILASTNSWMLVQGTFIANGGEAYLTIGNFRTDGNTTWTNHNPSAPAPDYAYYLFDDVSVVMLCDPLTNKTVQCGQPWDWDFNDIMVFDNCSGLNVNVSSGTNTTSYCPDVIQREWTLVDACGNTNVITQTVTVVDTNPPMLLCTGGANLAPNPSFENYVWCPFSVSQLPSAAPWFNPTVATPDYFNACSISPTVDVPLNMGGSQPPFSGQGYAGAFVYSLYGTNPPPGYREYIEAPLLAPLVAGVTYQVSFRVNLADVSGWAISEIGAHLSIGPILGPSTQGPLNFIPQVVNPSGNPLTSTNTWMLVQGTFTAVGGENHITLGNFRNDALTTAVMHLGTNSPSPNFRDFAYYYYEDIAVVPLCSFTNKTVVCGTQWDFDTPLAYDECSGDFLSVIVTTNWTTGICPKVHTRVWTIFDGCANTLMATQTVTEVDFTPPTLLCNGLNMLPNGDFENYFQCPPAFSFLSFAQPWIGWSSEFYHACAAFNTGVSVPGNWIGNQPAFSGSGYGGCYVYFNTGNSSNSIREYLESPLVAPLLAGQTYAVSFRVSRADNCTHGIAQIGAHFSTGNVTNYFAVTPQVVNPSTNIITSATNWTLISGTFTANGGENTVTLGNFLQDASTTAQFTGFGPINNSSYYYFDDVKVISVCTNVPVKMVACGAPWNFDPAPIAVDLCSGNNVTVTLASTVTNSACPLNAVRTWTLTDVCGNATNWSQTVITSTNGSSLVVNCDCLMDSALSLLSTNGCQGIVPNLSVLSNSPCILNNCGPLIITQLPPAGTVVGAGQTNITVKISNCAGITNTCILPFYVNPPTPTITCPPNIVVTGCSNSSAIVNFTATAIGNVGPIVYSPPSGSIFPLGTTFVTCTATSSCGGIAVCGFNVTVKPPRRIWDCMTKIIGIKINLPPPSGRMIQRPDFPGGGKGVDLENFSGTDGIRFDLGPAEKFTFSTVLDFNAPTNASFELRLPPGGGSLAGTPLVIFERACDTNCGWNVRLSPQIVFDPSAKFRTVVISEEGELFDSQIVERSQLDTNLLAVIKPMDGNTNALLTFTLDLKTREITLGLPGCDFTPSARHKGWDGCIYGNPKPRPTGTNKTARVVITPPISTPLPPITELDLRIDNLDTLAFDNPSITMSGRRWGDGHVTLMKAYDDGNERGMEFFADAEGGGVTAELGHAANFSLRMTPRDNYAPLAAQQFTIRGWPPGTTTNRPPPPVIDLRLTPDNSGLGGVALGASFADWGVSQVTLQLWNGTTLVAETNHVPATSGGTLAMLAGFPGIITCPSIGVVSLSDTNPIVVLEGLTCGSLGCAGTELRIIAEPSAMFTPPTAYTRLTTTIGEDMYYLLHDVQTVPACTAVPLQVTSTTNGVTLSWTGDGFHLQGAETVNGPWHDLGVESPAMIPAGSSARLFRLHCD